MDNRTHPQEGVSSELKLSEVQRYWLQHYQACQACGKSLAGYARGPGLAIKSFYYWKKRLQHIGAINIDVPSPPNLFKKVTIAPVAPVAAAGMNCRIQFTNGLSCELTGLSGLSLEQLLLTVSRLP